MDLYFSLKGKTFHLDLVFFPENWSQLGHQAFIMWKVLILY